MQVRNGRRPHGRLLGQQPAALPKDRRFFVQPTRTTSGLAPMQVCNIEWVMLGVGAVIAAATHDL